MSKAGERQLKSAFSDCCSSAVVSAGAVHYAVGRPSEGGLNPGGTNSMVYSSASQGRMVHLSPQVPPFASDVRVMFSLIARLCETVIDGGRSIFRVT